MMGTSLTQSRRGTKSELSDDPALLRVFVPSCESIVQAPGTVGFDWKVSSEDGCDYLEFTIGGNWRGEITGWMQEWTEATFTISGSGPHTLKWLYTKSSEQSGEGYVDWVRWYGSVPAEPAPTAWSTLNYVYDAQGRRIEKRYDGRTVLRYVYDGPHCIAEYDSGNNLKRKYIYGPGVDEPISMIESSGSYAGTYYYHFDALGSVVALTNASGNTVQVYEYDVYGRVGATDASHPNRMMFTGREFDKETGLYYYRARYYNPQIGRFLQTDPKAYADGMNLYRYCTNRPITFVDPDGTLKRKTPADLSYMDPNSPNYNPLLSEWCPQPSQWGVLQYFLWYMWADGAKVDLANTGLLSSFRITQMYRSSAGALKGNSCKRQRRGGSGG